VTHRAMRVLVAISLAVTTLFGASSAQAASGKKPVAMTFSASPASVKAGAAVTLDGRAWSGKKGNAGRVDLYFLKHGTKAWASTGSVKAADNGRFRRTVRASSSGTFRAVYRGNAKRKAATRHDGLIVQAPPAVNPPPTATPAPITLPVTLTLDGGNSFINIVKGTPFTISGRANVDEVDSADSAGGIDIYRGTLRKVDPPYLAGPRLIDYTKLTSTRARDDGTFAFTIEPTAATPYKVMYRGNAHRQEAFADFTVSVYEYLPTEPGELVSIKGDGVFSMPQRMTNIESGPLWLDWQAGVCNSALGGQFRVDFFDPDNPPPVAYDVLPPGVLFISNMIGSHPPSRVDLRPNPATTRGRVSVSGCEWTITLSQSAS
jgi:hypothetical protein